MRPRRCECSRDLMPSTVNDIFAAAGLTPAGVVPWGIPIPAAAPGVYAVSLCSERRTISSCLPRCPISDEAIAKWSRVCPDLLLDRMHPTVNAIGKRLSEFWLPDEVIIYIGLATSLHSRVGQYYRTPLGARRPHSGGYFLKALDDLPALFVHYATTNDPDDCELRMLARFCQNVSSTTKTVLRDPLHPFPFANLEFPQGTRKHHGLAGTRT
jgi:hypothetical protein